MADGKENGAGGGIREIVHVDMDAFFASVEQRDHPEYRGKPVIVGAPPNARGVVSTCSYEARKYGVHSAMPSREAGRLCPHGIFLPCDHHHYAEVSRQVMAIFDRFTPLVEQVSIDEAYLDVTGAFRLFGDGVAIGTAIRKAIREELQLTASVGVGPNKFIAKLCSELAKPDGLCAAPREKDALLSFLAEQPVGSLFGVGKVARASLERSGYRTVGDIQKAHFSTLVSLFGRSFAEQLVAYAHGEGSDEIVTWSEEKSISREHTFDEDCADREVVRQTLGMLVDDVGRRLRAAGKWATVAKLKLRWSDFTTITRQMPFRQAACDDFTLLEYARTLFDRERLVTPVRLIGFGVTGLQEEPGQQELDLFGSGAGGKGTDQERKERLSATLDALRAKLGKDAVKRL
ncbi:MAG: DNA polymerase IV [Kiritimatiellae bacterium]|nr:DNA polymerase IV [Kiritimatiellia bacterium]